MIPLQLSLAGFLSYREPVELDFTGFELACIAGPNGAGKSSLLDAITWALFGQARKRDDALINTQSNAAFVSLIFSYEGNVYRVQRTKPRDKTAMLEFHILQQSLTSDMDLKDLKSWKPLTERTLRDTETRIEQVLRLDYETFVNAAFFLQGKADRFTQQRPGDRKRILGSILGLEVWEVYRQRAADRRKALEGEVTGLDGRLQEIAAELVEEKTRRDRLKLLEGDLKRLRSERLTQESALENIRKIAATLAEQRKLVANFERQWRASSDRLQDLQSRVAARQSEKDEYVGIMARADQIEAAYAYWQALRGELSELDEIAMRFREQEKLREAPRDEINATRARLSQERESLQGRSQQVQDSLEEIENLAARLETVQAQAYAAEAQLLRRAEVDAGLENLRHAQVDAKAENLRLKNEMEELKERITRLKAADGAECPLCGQPLSPGERLALLDRLEGEGREMGDRYRTNQALVRRWEEEVAAQQLQLEALAQVEGEFRQHTQLQAQLEGRLAVLRSQSETWQVDGAARLKEVEALLVAESFAPEARARLAEVDAALKAIGYDAAGHDALRREEQASRNIEVELRKLESARAALAPLERELADLNTQVLALQDEASSQEEQFTEAASLLAAAEAQAPDLESAEQVCYQLAEQENRLRMEVGAALQKVQVLEDLKERRKRLEAKREELTAKIAQYRQLERAFGKDGVPALLIEQALPEIEARSNEVLDRLSGGNMSVRFVTQAAYKDKRRDDLRETLDIQISDGLGARDYEMFSGGEAFRVNFAIRLALSEVLAQRAGARLQTLVIDEGFGSQDTQGRQRLVEAINLVRDDFAKILVITHIDELKDQFPSRIEVDKTESGSCVQVI